LNKEEEKVPVSGNINKRQAKAQHKNLSKTKKPQKTIIEEDEESESDLD
jgi:hypothetical protein